MTFEGSVHDLYNLQPRYIRGIRYMTQIMAVSGLRVCRLKPWEPFTEGALDGGSPCRLSNLRNANVTCTCHLSMPMSPVEFKK